ncbi:MAG: DEAD/DEAH box helicase [Nitrospirota bacterium]|nr:DEAD/DEAH box helicase [Nitrospirota bacterium]
MRTLLTIAVIIYVIHLISNVFRRRHDLATPPEIDSPQQISHQQRSRSHKKAHSDIDIADIEINEDYKAVLNLVEVQNKSVYVTGKAGTGKSTLLKYLIATTKKNMVVLAPTGLAAINVGGQTIHSFFRFPPKLIKREDIKPSRNAILYQKLDAVIIDEVSMVRADLMDGIDHSLRLNRRRPHEPFGGVQMIFFGDLFQLPPVVRGKDLEAYFKEVYGAPYFFCSKAIRNSGIGFIDLKKIYRQSDGDFIQILNSIRENKLTAGTLRELNSKVVTNLASVARKDCVTLTTTNKAAFEINEEFLGAIKEKEFEYSADIQGKFDQSDYPTEASLRLKRGARIILLRNDPFKKWVNGTLARVSDLGENRISIDVDGSKYEINKEIWKKIEYYYDRNTKKIEERVIGSFEQYPIRLAWAITIHKSQGQTFDRVYIDLGSGAFAHGQTYVALSRCTSFNGIQLRRPVESRDVIFDPRVYGYAKVMANHSHNV